MITSLQQLVMLLHLLKNYAATTQYFAAINNPGTNAGIELFNNILNRL